jgi:hypothetical protein
MPTLVHFGMVILEVLFLVGWVGSIVVVLISGIEDVKTIFSKDENIERHHSTEI